MAPGTPGVARYVLELVVVGAGYLALAKLGWISAAIGPGATVEQVRDNWAKIADPAGQQAYMNGGEQTGKFFRKLQGG